MQAQTQMPLPEEEESYDLINPSGNQYFLFLCDERLYGVDAVDVVEIIDLPKVTKVPLLAPEIVGVCSIRGTMVGVIDLRKRMGITGGKLPKRQALAIVKREYESKTYYMGLIIDEIYEVDGLEETGFSQTPLFGAMVDPRFVKHMAKYDQMDVVILNLESVLDIKELSRVYTRPDIQKQERRQKSVKQQQSRRVVQRQEEQDDEDEIDIIKLIASSSNDLNQYLIFEGPDRQYYAKNVSKIEEIVALADLDIARNYDQSIVAGTANIRGEMLTLLNFDVWLGAKEGDAHRYNEVLILHYAGHKFGLVVRSTVMIAGIDPEQMQENSNSDSKANFITKVDMEGKKVLCTVVDSDQIVRDSFKEEQRLADSHIDAIAESMQSDKLALFADDSRLIRSLFEKTADRLGIRYEIYANGRELMDAIRRRNIEEIGLVVTDVEMPRMDGNRVLQELRSDERFDPVKVIVHTNMANDVLEKNLLDKGADAVVRKIDIQTLGKEIKKHMR